MVSASASSFGGPGVYDQGGAGEDLVQIRVGDRALDTQPKLGKLVIK